MANKINPHINYPGSKWRLANWITEKMPEHHSYLEPYFGTGAVLFTKKPSKIETINDVDGEVVNFFEVVKDPVLRLALREILAYTPYAREMYEKATEERGLTKGPVYRAANFATRMMMSQGYRVNQKTGWKKDVFGREAMYALRYWNELPKRIRDIGIRLKGVQIENRPALELIKRFDHDNVLMYLDPPYMLETRNMKQYDHEMTDEDHEELLKTIVESKAKIMISGYECDLYNRYLSEWRREQIPARTHRGAGRTENLWMNF